MLQLTVFFVVLSSHIFSSPFFTFFMLLLSSSIFLLISYLFFLYIFINILLLFSVTLISSSPFFSPSFCVLLLIFFLRFVTLSSPSAGFSRLATTGCQKLQSATLVRLEHGSLSRGAAPTVECYMMSQCGYMGCTSCIVR